MEIEQNERGVEQPERKRDQLHAEFLINFMQKELENSYKIPVKHSALVARNAHQLYSNGLNEVSSINAAAQNYSAFLQEPTVKIIWTESDKLNTGDIISLSEANSRFQNADQIMHERYGGHYYHKTRFQLNLYLNGKHVYYDGRQDFGDFEGSLIDHIKNDGNLQAYNQDYYKLIALHNPMDAQKMREKGHFILETLVPCLETHVSLSDMESMVQEHLQDPDLLTAGVDANYLHALEGYIQESRFCLSAGYDLPAEPKRIDFDPELAAYKQKILEELSSADTVADIPVEYLSDDNRSTVPQKNTKKESRDSPSKRHSKKSKRL